MCSKLVAAVSGSICIAVVSVSVGDTEMSFIHSGAVSSYRSVLRLCCGM